VEPVDGGVDGGVDDLREVVRDVREGHPFEIVAWVLLPEHLHAAWAFAEGDRDDPMRWRLLKAHFSRRVPSGERVRESRRKKGERGIWQRRFREHLIRDDLEPQETLGNDGDVGIRSSSQPMGYGATTLAAP
jgi:putative transposase